ncbi:MAG TPA: sigma-70 family RNA polymerase sigma factor [Iamia sp.]|nr:sigma-70 family RNA polymerase sigma factor [Iamia sp.]
MHPVDDDFEQWFRTTLDRVRRAARRVVGSEAEADDIAAEAFARALVRWASVRDLPHRDAWVVRVASNLAIDAVRARSRRERILIVQRAAEAVGDATDASAERMALVVALGGLPRRQREVITLRYLVGLPEAEVAAVLGVSANTVKTHLSRALATLRDRLGTSWEETSVAH